MVILEVKALDFVLLSKRGAVFNFSNVKEGGLKILSTTWCL